MYTALPCDDDVKRLKRKLLSGQKPWFEYPQENLVFVAITRGHRAKRPQTELAKQWLIDPIWALVQSAYPTHMKWAACIHPCRALIPLGMTATSKDRRPTMHEVAPRLRSFWVLSTSTP